MVKQQCLFGTFLTKKVPGRHFLFPESWRKGVKITEPNRQSGYWSVEEAWTCNRFMVDQHTRWKFQERYGFCFEHWAPYRCYEAGIWGRYPYSLFRIPGIPRYHEFWSNLWAGKVSVRSVLARKPQSSRRFQIDNYGLYRRKISWYCTTLRRDL